jgi:hypothetical protein
MGDKGRNVIEATRIEEPRPDESVRLAISGVERPTDVVEQRSQFEAISHFRCQPG